MFQTWQLVGFPFDPKTMTWFHFQFIGACHTMVMEKQSGKQSGTLSQTFTGDTSLFDRLENAARTRKQ